MADAHDRDDFGFTELLPLGADDTPYRLVTTEGVSTFDTPEGTFLKVEPEAIRRLTAEAMRDIAHFLRPAHLQQLRNILDDPEASANDRFVATDLLKNAADRGRRRAADVPGHRHGDRQGQEGPVRVHRWRRRARDRPRHPGHLPHEQPALQPDGAAHDVRRDEHRHQPARRDQDLGDRRRRLQVPVHRQGRRQRQQELPVPGDQGAAQRGDAAARGCSTRCSRSAPPPARRTTSPS